MYLVNKYHVPGDTAADEADTAAALRDDTMDEKTG